MQPRARIAEPSGAETEAGGVQGRRSSWPTYLGRTTFLLLLVDVFQPSFHTFVSYQHEDEETNSGVLLAAIQRPPVCRFSSESFPSR